MDLKGFHFCSQLVTIKNIIYNCIAWKQEMYGVLFYICLDDDGAPKFIRYQDNHETSKPYFFEMSAHKIN